MSEWNHSICDACWIKRCREAGEPDRTPVRMKDGFCEPMKCCFCETVHKSGIFVREVPGRCPCKGEHPVVTQKEESAIDLMPKIGGRINELADELAKKCIHYAAEFRDDVYDKTKDHNIANNAAIRGVAMTLATVMALVAQVALENKVPLNELYKSVDFDLNEAICQIMGKAMGDKGTIVTMQVEEKPKRKKREGGP